MAVPMVGNGFREAKLVHMAYERLVAWLGRHGWFRPQQAAEEQNPQRLILEETQNLKKLLRKQGLLLEAVHQEQQVLANRDQQDLEPLLDLCDAFFHLRRAFQNPGLMSRQHAQVLHLVHQRLHRFALAFGIEMILTEGIPFDARLHEVVSNRNPEASLLEVLEVIQPGYLRNGNVLRPARVIVGNDGEALINQPEGSSTA